MLSHLESGFIKQTPRFVGNEITIQHKKHPNIQMSKRLVKDNYRFTPIIKLK